MLFIQKSVGKIKLKTVAMSAILLAAVMLAGAGNAQAQDQGVLNEKQLSELDQKANKWVSEAGVTDPAKAAKVAGFVKKHLVSVYTWNKTHSIDEVPAGVNPRTGEKLTDLDRSMIIQSTMPEEVHTSLMDSLKANLSPDQVEKILDGYTIGKVAFTLKGYQAIVPNLTEKETAEILKNLKQAREQAIDYKSMKEISAIFEIYKTKNEQYLNNNGRNWHQMFGDYVRKVQAEKKAKANKGK